MERNIQKTGLINLLVMFTVGVAGFAVARYCNSLAGQVAILYIGLGTLVAAVSWFQMRLEERERLEKIELEELAKGHSDTALFQARASELFPSQRAREQFERFFVPAFSVILFLSQLAGAYFLWRWLSRPTTVPELQEPTVALAMFGVFALVLFLLGKFSTTLTRLEGHRLLRPGAAYLLLGAYLCFAVALGTVGVLVEFPRADFYVAYVLCALLAVVAAESLVTLVLEIYRPRVRGRVERPLYESRLVGLLGQPEGLITTAAQAIDYQFGFKVSETWFYRFFQRALLWLVPLQLLLLLLSTSFVIIEPGEQALLERFGRPVPGRTVLSSGPHLVWPYPIDKVNRFKTEQIQSFNVGFTPDPQAENQNIVLWKVAHTKEENFLVANREPAAPAAGDQSTSKRTPPVSLLSVSIPVLYQITDLEAWVYNNEDAPSLLQDVATREVVRYLAGADMNDLMSSGRLEASDTLAQRIQAEADEHQLGARIVAVGLQDLHPPVKVAEDYEKVIGAIQTKQAKILGARADAIRTNALAGAQAAKVINGAEAESVSRQMGALAQAGLFTNQIPAFDAAPAVYAQRYYLQTFVRATASARKYILLTTNTHDVLMFDLQDKVGDLLNSLTVPPPKAK